MNQERLNWAWRVAILAVLGWIGAELHLLRYESNNGPDWETTEHLRRIDRNTDKTETHTREAAGALEALRRSR